MTSKKASLFMPLIIGMCSGTANAQSDMSARITVLPGKSIAFARMQARADARAEELRAAWQAAGHVAPDTTSAPEILAGKIESASLNVARPPAAPATTVAYKTGAAGLESIYLYFYSTTTGQEVLVTYQTPIGAPASTRGAITLQQPRSTVLGISALGSFGLYSAPGQWKLTYAYIYDEAGNETFYDASKLASLFPGLTLTVVNTVGADLTPPTVTAGRLLTPTVSESSTSPYFAASLTVADAQSGGLTALIFITPPGNDGGYAYNAYPPSPVHNGTIIDYNTVSGQPTGTWSIYGYQACDVAGNCLSDFNASDVRALFGTTTFTVTE